LNCRSQVAPLRQIQIMRLLLFGLSLFAAFYVSEAQEVTAYNIYNSKGKQISFEKSIKLMHDADVVLFGELHNNPICHWLQLEVVQALNADRKMILGAEMFETDDQVVVDEYLADQIKLDHLKKEAKVWPNFETDYLPLIEAAIEYSVPFIATNVPRRYASYVAKNGPEALAQLSDEAKSFLPPLPLKVPENDTGYAEMAEMMGGHRHGMDMSNMVAAQAIKDYTMAWNIHQNLHEDAVFLHFHGTFHSHLYSGIYTYLKQMDPELNIVVIHSLEQDNCHIEESDTKQADIIISVNTDMTKTY